MKQRSAVSQLIIYHRAKLHNIINKLNIDFGSSLIKFG